MKYQSNNKNILFACAGFSGGVAKMITYVSSLCLKEFNQVSLLYTSCRDTALSHNINRYQIQNTQTRFKYLNRLLAINNLRKTIKEISPDIICCFGTEIAVMVSISVLGMKNIKIVHADRADPYNLSFLWGILSKWAFRTADHCIFQLEKQQLFYGKNVIKKSTIIPNAYIATGAFNDSIEICEKKIVSVGRFVYQKGFDTLIRAFEIVHSRHPEYKLIIYGDGPLKSNYIQLINSLNLNENVEMPGYTQNSMASIKNASVFVLSSRFEGIPNSLIEALAIGIPTVSTDCSPGGADFLTNHGERGLLVPIDDASKMAHSICQIIEDTNLAQNLRLRGKEIVSMLEPNKINHLWIKILSSI